MSSVVGHACVVLMLGLLGIYDENGQCVVKAGPHYARPAEWFDIRYAPIDQYKKIPGRE